MDRVGGYRLISDPRLMVNQQVRFPRSKKKRIRQKWANQAKNFVNIPDKQLYLSEAAGTIFGHPLAIAEILRAKRDRGGP